MKTRELKQSLATAADELNEFVVRLAELTENVPDHLRHDMRVAVENVRAEVVTLDVLRRRAKA